MVSCDKSQHGTREGGRLSNPHDGSLTQTQLQQKTRPAAAAAAAGQRGSVNLTNPGRISTGLKLTGLRTHLQLEQQTPSGRSPNAAGAQRSNSEASADMNIPKPQLLRPTVHQNTVIMITYLGCS